MTPKTIIFMGPQGSGKGTQVALLQAKLKAVENCPVVDIQTGRLFRDLADSGLYAGQRVGELIEAGQLVPDTFTNAMWIADMRDRVTADAHLLLDGFPRTTAQARVVDEMFTFFDRGPASIINLEVPEEVVVERMLARGRADDTSESIKVRLAAYQENTVPVLAYYKATADVTVHDINGAQDEAAVQADICAALQLGVE